MSNAMPDIHIRPLDPDEVRARAGEIAEVYLAAFGADADAAEWFVAEQLTRHLGYAGFVMLVAEVEGWIAGFAYGYMSRPGPWWHDTVGPALREAGHAAWLVDAFEFVEFVVRPAMQRRGIGAVLMERMLAGVRHRHVLLSTGAAAANPATALYRRMGFVDLLPEFRYPGGGEPARIMGLARGPGRPSP